jgi:adenylate cyclase
MDSHGGTAAVDAGGAPDQAKIRALNGVSLLEALRNARIPHASVCGGRARCTTCRVYVSSGLDELDPPNELEARALNRIKAGKGIRLACQLQPKADLAITPLVMANQSLAATLHSGGVQGHEEYVVAMFVDMRGSTNLGERVLAYDVVFILNRFFTELSTALSESHGHYAQFAGDGLMALYGLEPERKSRACADALAGAREMFRRIGILNEQLQREFGESVQMGIGIHGGDAIVGTMGPPSTPLLTAVGDNINIAARLEAQTKTLGCDLIVSTATLESEGIDYSADQVQQVEVRGRDNHVRICRFSSEQLAAMDITNV